MRRNSPTWGATFGATLGVQLLGCNFWCTRPGNPDCRPFLRSAVVAAPPTTTAVCRRRARSTRASLAFLSWCHHGGLRCRGASLTAASVLRRRLCVPSPCSLDVSVAGFSTLVLPPRSAVQGCKFDCSLCPSTSAVCRRRARSTRASLASLSWCYHRGLRCRGASLTAAPVLRRRLCAVALLARRERRWLL